jgi:uncharacterized membrane protein
MSDDQQIPQEQSQDQTSQPAQSQEVAGVGLMIAAFTDEDAGDQVLKAMKQAKKQGQFDYEAAAIIKREADGDIHYHETGDMSTGKGAGIGALVGGVIGILGGPAGIALGAGAGAAIGAIAAHGDAGFRDSNLEEIGEALQPGSSAVMIITSKDFLHEFRKQVSEEEMQPMMQSVAATIADAQAQGQDMLLGFVLTDQGAAVQRLAFDETSVAFFSAVVTEEGVAVGQAYADETGLIYQVGAADDTGAVVETGAVTDEGAAVVQESATADSDEITVVAAVAVPDDDSGDASDDAAPSDDDSAPAASDQPAADDTPAQKDPPA